jgi:hypothetical protein
MAKGVAKNI